MNQQCVLLTMCSLSKEKVCTHLQTYLNLSWSAFSLNRCIMFCGKENKSVLFICLISVMLLCLMFIVSYSGEKLMGEVQVSPYNMLNNAGG